MTEIIPDRLVVFVDEVGTEYPVAVPSLGHVDREVRHVAYCVACKNVAELTWKPHGELRYQRMGRL